MMSSQPHQPDVDQSPPEKLIDSEDQYISLDEVSAKPEKPIDGQNQCLSWNEEDDFNTEGLRVLAVDDSLVCLKVLLALLHHCKYNVTETTNPVEALQILRMRKHEFDIVITDLRMLEMDGLVLLQKISLEMDLPVVMLSADDSLENIMKAIRYGARDYIIKPPRMAQIKNVWQHVVRKRLFGSGFMDAAAVNKNNSSGVTIEEETDQSPLPVVESKRKLAETQGDGEEAASTWNGGNGEESNTAAKKKRRVNWTVELHNKFIDAIEKIGPNAVPMEILKVMNVPWLTRANVASHLQKFKNALRGQAQSAPQGRNGYSNSAAGQNGYSKGMMNYGSLSIGASPQRFSYQQNNPNPNPNPRILPISTNLHQSRLLSQNQHYSHPLNYQAPTMLNNAPLPPRNVLKNMQSHPPLPRFNGLRFSALGTISNNMLNSYSFSEPYPAYPSAAAAAVADANAQQKDALAGGQNYVGLAIESQNTYPQLDWTSAPDLQDSLMISPDVKSSNFDIVSFEDTEMERWSMNNNCTAPFETNNKCEVKTFHSTPQEELHIDASSEPMNTNLSDEDEFNNMVNSFNFEGPPSL